MNQEAYENLDRDQINAIDDSRNENLRPPSQAALNR